MNQATGKLIMLIGLAMLVLGMGVYFFHDKLNWFGRLPGDVRVEKENFRLFFPISTMILISIVINLVIWLVRKFLN